MMIYMLVIIIVFVHIYICNVFFIEYDVLLIDDHIYDVCMDVDEI